MVLEGFVPQRQILGWMRGRENSSFNTQLNIFTWIHAKWMLQLHAVQSLSPTWSHSANKCAILAQHFIKSGVEISSGNISMVDPIKCIKLMHTWNKPTKAIKHKAALVGNVMVCEMVQGKLGDFSRERS
jgi:hypothetical protein